MASLNSVSLIGHLGADPDVRFMTNGDAVASMRLATTEKWKDKNSGEAKEATEWHRLVCYRKLADIVQTLEIKKGAQLYVQGKLKTRKWTDKEGVEKYTTEIEVHELQLLGKRESGGGQRNESSAQGRPQQAPSQRPASKVADDNFEDCPF